MLGFSIILATIDLIGINVAISLLPCIVVAKTPVEINHILN
jgi:hypothetical protein